MCMFHNKTYVDENLLWQFMGKFHLIKIRSSSRSIYYFLLSLHNFIGINKVHKEVTSSEVSSGDFMRNSGSYFHDVISINIRKGNHHNWTAGVRTRDNYSCLLFCCFFHKSAEKSKQIIPVVKNARIELKLLY